jgi:hypothetical protein
VSAGPVPPAVESHTTLIGRAFSDSRTFIAGISNAVVTGAAVQVNPSGQLGVAASSARFKLDVRDLGSASAALYRLRPVAFRYRPEIDRAGALQYGLIAEEVERAAPELVVHDSAGRVFTVRYELLVPMLLNEIQRLEQRLARLEAAVKPVAAPADLQSRRVHR